jgi:hypothetical protein
VSLRLVRLQVGEDGSVLADFDTGCAGDQVSASFTVTATRGISLASPTSNMFAEFAGSIGEVRAVTAAVIAFAAASQDPAR